jgi:hypothetical protein
VGSVVALWYLGHSPAHLWLLGRSGRAGADAAIRPEVAGEGIITMARSDVSCAEEAAGVVNAIATSTQQRLEVTMH